MLSIASMPFSCVPQQPHSQVIALTAFSTAKIPANRPVTGEQIPPAALHSAVKLRFHLCLIRYALVRRIYIARETEYGIQLRRWLG